MTRPITDAISPFFIVSSVERTVAFYRDKLGFEALPNSKRHPWARWDAFEDTHDGLRGFEITDPDGYVLFFGRPR